MPYNNAAIAPSKEPNGTTQLPLSRVRRIVMVDNEMSTLATPASFVITIATEMFIQYLAEQAHNVVKSERKPRRNIQYRDLSSAVSRLENLEFLQDIVPKTVPFKTVKEPRPRAGPSTTNGEGAVEAGQTTLTVMNGNANGFAAAAGPSGTNGVEAMIDEDDGENPDEQLMRESRRAARVSEGSTVEGKDVEMK